MKFSQTITLSTLLVLTTSTPILESRQTAAVDTQPMASAEAQAEATNKFSTTENGLTSGGCKAMTVIFARGTTETGNVGTLAGPPFFNALEASVGAGNVAVQGVDYPADIPGFLAGGDAGGSKTMASLVQQAMTQCPSTKIVMAGYRYVFFSH
jgi:cutinase